MLLRVSCDRCRLSPLWTDDPVSLLDSGCRYLVSCSAHLVDEQFAAVRFDRGGGCHSFFRLPGFPRTQGASAATPTESRSAFRLGVVPCVAAVLASLALASAYENAAMVFVLCVLAAPPLATFLLYRTSPKAFIAPLISLMVAALGIDVLGIGATSASPLNGVLLASAAIGGPIVFDLEFFDLARVVRWDLVDKRWAALTFVVFTALLLAIQFPSASRIARREDEAIIRRLAPRIKTQGSSLVLERLDPRLARDAERRLRVVAGGHSYELAGASSETAVDQKSVATRIERNGAVRSYRVRRDRNERVTLVLPLRGDRVPAEVEIDGVRGPATTYSAKVALAK